MNSIMDAAPVQDSTVWARAFAAVYDPFLWAGERAGVRALRRELLARARGCTAEIGSGTGPNLPYDPDDLDELILAEPDRSMHRRLEGSWRAVPTIVRPLIAGRAQIETRDE